MTMRRSPPRVRLCRSKRPENRGATEGSRPLAASACINFVRRRGRHRGPLFERRDAATSVTQQQPNVSTQAKTEPPPADIAPDLNAKNTEIKAPVQPETSSVTPDDERAQKSEAPKIARREDADRKSAPPAAMKREADQDAAKLVRKRRVQPANSEIPLRRNRRTDAGRIEDLFTGPNP